MSTISPTIKTLIDELLLEELDFVELDVKRMLDVLQACNASYRSGEPLVPDVIYDAWHYDFAMQHPLHPYLQNVEEEEFVGKKVDLPARMLSTDKAYSHDEVYRWLDRVQAAARNLGIPMGEIVIRATAKLDGFAGYDDAKTLYTRGNGRQGTDIGHVFAKGLQVANNGKRGLGPGEIVIHKGYFREHLSEHFDNSRNFQSSVLAAESDAVTQKAIDDGAVVFYPFKLLPAWEGQIVEFKKWLAENDSKLQEESLYDVDGVVFECTNALVKEFMGATNHHHRWQIALKKNTESAQPEVVRVIPQTSRNGKLTPVAEIEPTRLCGAEITRVTAHHYGMVRDKGIGRGTMIKLVRSGMVIPKIDDVIFPARAEIPKQCPSCGHDLVWIEDNLFCPNHNYCRDQIEKKVLHFFSTLGNNDGFGPATISNFYDHGIKTIAQVYSMRYDKATLQHMGYGAKTIANMHHAMESSRHVAIEDFRFLAAWGVEYLGLGVSEKLLQHHKLLDIFKLEVKDIAAIDGLGKKSGAMIVDGLAAIRKQFKEVYALGFALKETELLKDKAKVKTPISGKHIVFTGSFETAKRKELEKQAKAMGAKVGANVTGKTTWLVVGDKPGAVKVKDAKQHNTVCLSETEYLQKLEK